MEGPTTEERVPGTFSAFKEIKNECRNIGKSKEPGSDFLPRIIRCNSNSFYETLRSIQIETPAATFDDNNDVCIFKNGLSVSDLDNRLSLSDNFNIGGLDGKTSKIKQIVEDAISAGSKQVVTNILDQVNQLTTSEKLLLYLKLPTGRSASADPLRQPLNPLGSRFEIHQTITWIKTHLEEDQDVSLPKQDVYDEYITYCSSNSMKPLSTADFGKVMKQVFPNVRPRRLGTRGNSRYCYAGLRKRMKLDAPILPDLGQYTKHTGVSCSDDRVLGAASTLIREWAEKLLGVQFNSLQDLACHLVDKLCVDSRSVAAFTILSSLNKCNGKSSNLLEDSSLPLAIAVTSGGAQTSKHRETQLQLQRKLQEREIIREQKRKLQDQQQHSILVTKVHGSDKLKAKRARMCQNDSGSTLQVLEGKDVKRTHITNSLSQGYSPTLTVAHATICDKEPCTVVECKSTPMGDVENDKEGQNNEKLLSGCVDINSVTVNERLSSKDDAVQRQISNSSAQTSSNVSVLNSPHKDTFSVEQRNISCNILNRNSEIVNDSTNVGQEVLPMSNLPITCENVSCSQVLNTITSNKMISSSSVKSPCKKVAGHKIPIPRITNPKPSKLSNVIIFPSMASQSSSKKYKPIQPKPESESIVKVIDIEESSDKLYGTKIGCKVSNTVVSTECTSENKANEELSASPRQTVKDEMNIRCLEKDALDEYFNNGNNSQEQEEELVRYFQHQTSSSSNEESEENLSLTEPINVPKSSESTHVKSDKLSQLRLLLERNLTTVPSNRSSTGAFNSSFQGSTLPSKDNEKPVKCENSSWSNSNRHIPHGASAAASLSLLSQRNQIQNRNCPIKPGLLLPSLLAGSHSTSSLSTRRRVSFETSVLDNSQETHTVPPSPNTRRRIFSFTPISPGPHSPLGSHHSRASSKPSSANVSPFVSPRNTPVPRTRHSIQTLQMLSSSYFSSKQSTSSSDLSCNHKTTNCAAKVVRSNSVNSQLPSSQYTQLRPRAHSTTTPVLQNSQGNVHHSHGTKCRSPNLEIRKESDSTFIISNPNAPPMSPLSVSAPHSPVISFSNNAERMAPDSLLQAMLRSSKRHTLLSEPNQIQEIPSSVSDHVDATDPQLQISLQLNTDPLSHEISQFFPDDSSENHFANTAFQYRSQSVPLHRMSSLSALVSPLNIQQSPLYAGHQQTFSINNFCSSATSSVAPTPVPSEFTDFVNVTDNSTSTNMLLVTNERNDPEVETLNTENLQRIFTLFSDAQGEQQHDDSGLALTLTADLPETEFSVNQNRIGEQFSRSYPNTPVPYKMPGIRDQTDASFNTEVLENAGPLISRSYPSTPLLNVPLFTTTDDDSSFSNLNDNEASPMSQLTLSALNLRSTDTSTRRNITTFLEEEELNLETFDALQECDTFSQLVQEVNQSNSDNT